MKFLIPPNTLATRAGRLPTSTSTNSPSQELLLEFFEAIETMMHNDQDSYFDARFDFDDLDEVDGSMLEAKLNPIPAKELPAQQCKFTTNNGTKVKVITLTDHRLHDVDIPPDATTDFRHQLASKYFAEIQPALISSPSGICCIMDVEYITQQHIEYAKMLVMSIPNKYKNSTWYYTEN